MYRTFLFLLLLAALPLASFGQNINAAPPSDPPGGCPEPRPGPPDCPCDDGTYVANGSVLFAQRFGRSPLVAGAPTGFMEVFEPTAARLPTGPDILRFDHPMMRRVVDRPARPGDISRVTVEEANGWLLHYRDGIPCEGSAGADLRLTALEDGTLVEQLEDRTLVFYGADNAPTHLVTPAGVRLDESNWQIDVVWDDAAIGQVRSEADGLMDMQRLERGSFRLAWYPPSAVPAEKGADGRYHPSGAPAKTFEFAYSRVGAEHRLALHERRSDLFQFDYLWTTENGRDWTFVRDPAGLSIVDERSSTPHPAPKGFRYAGRQVRRRVRYGGDGSVSAVFETGRDYHTLDDGSIFAGPHVAAEIPPWAHTPQTNAVHSPSPMPPSAYGGAPASPLAGRPEYELNEWGGRTDFSYDAEGRRTLAATSVYGALAQTTAHTYAAVATNSADIAARFPDRRPRRTVVTRAGVVVSDTEHAYALAADGGRVETVTRNDPATGASLSSRVEYYPVDAANAVERGRPRLSVAEDGTATAYAYAASPGGGYVRTATTGIFDAASGSVAVVPGASTRDVDTFDFRGDLMRTETSVLVGGDWQPAGWTAYAYNLMHRRTGFTNHRGDAESSEWICTGPIWQRLADGTSVSNVFDRAKRIVSSTRTTPLGSVTTRYEYDALDRRTLSETITPDGGRLRHIYLYDARGRLRRAETAAYGAGGGAPVLLRVSTTDYSADSRTVTRTSPSGTVETTRLNPDGSVASVSGDLRPVEMRLHGVDAATGLVWTEIRTAAVTNAPSVLASRVWDNALGQTVRRETPSAPGFLRIGSLAYDARGLLASETESFAAADGTGNAEPGIATSYTYDALGRLGRTIKTAGTEWRAEDTPSDYVFDSADGSVWERTASIVSCSDAAIAPLTNRVDRKLWPLSQDERSCVVATDPRGNATRETESFDRAAARSERRTYAPWAARPFHAISVAGHPVLEVDFAGVTNAFACDALGRRLSAADGSGNVTLYAYNPSGNPLAVTDAAGFTTTYTYDLLGRRIASTDPLGNTTHTAYDGADRVVAEWGAAYPKQVEYDAYGRLASLKTWRGTNEVAGLEQMASSTAASNLTEWGYDEATGLLVSKSFHVDSERPVRYTYDARGNLVDSHGLGFPPHAYDAWGQWVSDGLHRHVAYDALGRCTEADFSFYFPLDPPREELDFLFATNRFVYDAFGDCSLELQGNASLKRERDAFGRQTSILVSLPTGETNATQYAYDDCGRLASISTPGTTFVFEYDRETGFPLGCSTEDISRHILRSACGVVTNVVFRFAGVERFREEGGIDINQRLVRRDCILDNEKGSHGYGYNVRGEIVQETGLFPSCYVYDESGNRCRRSTPDRTITYETRDGNLSLWVYEDKQDIYGAPYDNKGCLVQYRDYDYSHAFDYANVARLGRRLSLNDSRPPSLFHYAYDPFGRLFCSCGVAYQYSETSATTETNSLATSMERRHYVWDYDRIVAQWSECLTPENRSLTPAVFYTWGMDESGDVYGSGGGGGLLMECSAGGRSFPVLDSLGNVVAYLDALGNVQASACYSAFGEMNATGDFATHLHWFSTQPYNPTNCAVMYRHRWLLPELGRWTARDPYGENGGINLYVPCGNDLVNHMDFLGLNTDIPPPQGKSFPNIISSSNVDDMWMLPCECDAADIRRLLVQKLQEAANKTHDDHVAKLGMHWLSRESGGYICCGTDKSIYATGPSFGDWRDENDNHFDADTVVQHILVHPSLQLTPTMEKVQEYKCAEGDHSVAFYHAHPDTGGNLSPADIALISAGHVENPGLGEKMLNVHGSGGDLAGRSDDWAS